MKIRKGDTGRWCTVKFEDVGRVDGIIINVNPEFKSLDVYIPALDTVEDPDFSQIVEIRDHIEAA
jgi:hypothetical protein